MEVSEDTDTPCPFCEASTDSVVFSTQHTVALWDRSPVTEGHMLLVPSRHVDRWTDLDQAEIEDLAKTLGHAQEMLTARYGVEDFNVGFDHGQAAGQTISHFHVHVIPRRNGDTAYPRGGIRQVVPQKESNLITGKGAASDIPHERALIAGGEDPLIHHLLPHIQQAQAVDITVAFILESGVRLLQPAFQDLLDRGGRLRIVAGDYLDVTDPVALRQLLDLTGDVTRWIFEASITSFHPKSWVIRLTNGRGIAIVGSSNITETALRSGIEWNYRVYDSHFTYGFRDVARGFEAMLSRPEIRELTHDWIDRYEARRVKTTPKLRSFSEVAEEPPSPPPKPHSIQIQALLALKKARSEGYTAGLVVLATGLGKTWLAAFDSEAFSRVLFVAHREEILSQATATFRRIRPNARMGRYTGQEKDLTADVVFASIQTLGRAAHLRNFSPEAFDYIIVDEFHHASARTYRALLDYFTPRFLLGLTATPERTDGGDLLGLCQENLVFRCDLFAGIENELLSPFRYFGIPDDIDYAQIPWRSAFFDEEALTAALATRARAQNALDQWRDKKGHRTIGFCCSRLHADFMAGYFRENGIRAAAIHSGETSAPRLASLEQLQAGDLEIVFAVDILNEGVDIPLVDTILMLRPTQSSIIWLQQFGRGLRRAIGKTHLTVLDYIGNHRVFLTKARALLQVEDGDRALSIALEAVSRQEVTLPPGCEITYDLKALDILKSLLRPTKDADALEAFYRDFSERHRQRPTASEVFHAGFRPQTTGHGSWFSFVRDMGDLGPGEQRVYERHGAFLDSLQATVMVRSYKMLLLQVLLVKDRLPGQIHIDALTEGIVSIAMRNPSYKRDISVSLADFGAVKRLMIQNPVAAWTNALRPSEFAYFTYSNETFSSTFDVELDIRPAFREMVRELVDWRLIQYLSRMPNLESLEQLDAPARATDKLELWREYARKEIPAYFGEVFNTGAWNSGIVTAGQNLILLVTLEKENMATGSHYADHFIDALTFQWQSQSQTTTTSRRGKILSGELPGHAIHLFIRPTKLRGQYGAPFIYCGQPGFVRWTGERPITVTWKLPEPVPVHLQRIFKIGLEN